jgi:hypothetical protein
MSAKSKLKDRIKRFLGWPIIKIELDDSQINDNIEFARNQFIKWAAGHSTQETYFTKMLIGGETLYDMPGGVTEVIGYDTYVNEMGGINTLFTIENYLYNQGMFAILNAGGGGDYNLVSYHIALDFLQSLQRYSPDTYSFKYHKSTNQLEIQPSPPSGNSLFALDENGVETEYDSPGWILVRSFMISHASLSGSNYTLTDNDDLYNSLWVEQYSRALCKITLGYIRRKFASSTLLGNQGTALDGDSLVSEGSAEKEVLEEALRQKEAYIGYGITIG